MYGELIPCGGGDAIPLLKTELLIGRRSRCDVTLVFPNISSHHCRLDLINGYWHVRDLNSRNGIKVNGERCESKWLMPGDVLSVAKHRFEISYTPSGDAPPPEDEESTFSLSLMEKAGLARRPAGPSRPAQRKIELPPSERETDDDRALRFLSDDDEDSQ